MSEEFYRGGGIASVVPPMLIGVSIAYMTLSLVVAFHFYRFGGASIENAGLVLGVVLQGAFVCLCGICLGLITENSAASRKALERGR